MSRFRETADTTGAGALVLALFSFDVYAANVRGEGGGLSAGLINLIINPLIWALFIPLFLAGWALALFLAMRFLRTQNIGRAALLTLLIGMAMVGVAGSIHALYVVPAAFLAVPLGVLFARKLTAFRLATT